MGHWWQYPQIPGMAGHYLTTLGGHTHPTKTTFGIVDTVFDRFELRGSVSYGGVHTNPSAARATIGHWGQCPTPQGW